MLAAPFYNPKYDLTLKKTASVPHFSKLLGRKAKNKPVYCSNDYELTHEDYDSMSAKRKIPNFSKMHGRTTLKSNFSIN